MGSTQFLPGKCGCLFQDGVRLGGGIDRAVEVELLHVVVGGRGDENDGDGGAIITLVAVPDVLLLLVVADNVKLLLNA